MHPRRVTSIEQTAGTSVSEVRFLPRSATSGCQHLAVTLGKSVWSVLSMWSVTTRGAETKASKKVAEWGPRGAIFTGFVVNDVEGSEVTMAISYQLHEEYFVKLLSLSHTIETETQPETYNIVEVHTMRTSCVPKTLSGDLLVLADDDARAEVWDWRKGTCAVLEHLGGNGTIQTNACLQVFLSPESQSIIVARARSLHVFPWPHLTSRPDTPRDSSNDDDVHSLDRNLNRGPSVYRPLASHSFGWVDGMAINVLPGDPCTSEPCRLPALNILVRGESDDPWASDVQYLEVWALVPNVEYLAWMDDGDSVHGGGMLSSSSLNEAPVSSDGRVLPVSTGGPSPPRTDLPSSIDGDALSSPSPPPPISPYTFPPTLTTTIPCPHGALRCKQVALGQFGTAVWIRPGTRRGWGTADWEQSANGNAYANVVDFGLVVLTDDVAGAGGGGGILPSALPALMTNGGCDSSANANSSAEAETLVGVSLTSCWGVESGAPGSGRVDDPMGFGDVQNEKRSAVEIYANDASTSWNVFDYDEAGGRVVLASSFGRVVVYEL